MCSLGVGSGRRSWNRRQRSPGNENIYPIQVHVRGEKNAFDTRQGIVPGNRAENDALLERIGADQKAVRQLKVFEVTAAGCDGSTDATDDHVFWVAASTEEIVKTAIKDTGPAFCGEIEMDHIDLADADFTLPEQSMQLSVALLEKASDQRNLNRQVRSRGSRP